VSWKIAWASARGAVERSRVKIANTIDRGRSRRAYAEFDRVANLPNDLFEAAMVGGREHDRTDIANGAIFFEGLVLSLRLKSNARRTTRKLSGTWRNSVPPPNTALQSGATSFGLPRETEEERAREGALLDLELEDEWKDHQSVA
jgi:hypothetical protein